MRGENNSFGHLFKGVLSGLRHEKEMSHAGRGSVDQRCVIYGRPTFLSVSDCTTVPQSFSTTTTTGLGPAEKLCLTQTYPLLTRARHISQSAVLGSRRWSSMKDRSHSERPEDWDFTATATVLWLTSCLLCVLSLEMVTSSS